MIGGLRKLGRLVWLAVALAPVLAVAETADSTFTYSILKEGEPIGKETYQFTRDGDQIGVQLTVDSSVHILFLDFRYHHRRTESWSGERLDALIADTDDDGTKHHLEARSDGQGGLTLSSDGKKQPIPAGAFPLSMWRRSLLGHTTLFAVESDDGFFDVAFKDLGADPLIIGGKRVACEHFAMTGDVDRDLWYDTDVMLAKVTFRRRGFGISIVRDP